MSLRGVVSVEVRGAGDVSKKLAKITDDRRKAAIDEMNKGAFAIHSWIVSDMNRPKSGQGYPSGKSSVHIASAPGESPARDTGELVRKLRVSLANKADPNPQATVISAAEYARDLEFGTKKIYI